MPSTPSVIDEWGYPLQRHGASWDRSGYAAHLAQTLIGLAATGVDAQSRGLLIEVWSAGAMRMLGQVHHDGTPNPSYHALRAFEELQATPRQVSIEGAPFARAVAGVDGSGRRGMLLITYGTVTSVLRCEPPGAEVTGVRRTRQRPSGPAALYCALTILLVVLIAGIASRAGVKALVKRTPFAASRSMLGVSASGPS